MHGTAGNGRFGGFPGVSRNSPETAVSGVWPTPLSGGGRLARNPLSGGFRRGGFPTSIFDLSKTSILDDRKWVLFEVSNSTSKRGSKSTSEIVDFRGAFRALFEVRIRALFELEKSDEKVRNVENRGSHFTHFLSTKMSVFFVRKGTYKTTVFDPFSGRKSTPEKGGPEGLFSGRKSTFLATFKTRFQEGLGIRSKDDGLLGMEFDPKTAPKPPSNRGAAINEYT